MDNEPNPPLPDPLPENPTNWRTRLKEATRTRLSGVGSSEWTKELIGKFQGADPASIAEWLNNKFQKHGTAFWGKLVTVIFSTYFLADISGILVSNYLPKPPVIRAPKSSISGKKTRTRETYEPIFARNLFSSKKLIPGEELPTGGAPDQGGAPIRTTLPFNLIGTLILRDEIRSIATIEDKSAAAVYPVRIQDEIPSKARILQIEANRVVFLNIGSGRREFIDLPEDINSTAPRITLGGPRSTGAGIEQVAPTQFNVSRLEVDKALSNMSEILTQARAVPNFENGVPAGYKLFQIVPGSIYSKLGLQNGDVIAGVDGEPINDPARAFELLGRLKTANRLELQVKRDGRVLNNAYDFR